MLIEKIKFMDENIEITFMATSANHFLTDG